MSINLLASIIAFTMAIIIIPSGINLLKRCQFQQTVRKDGPAQHLSKENIPTCGGAMIIMCTIIPCLIFISGNIKTIILLIALLGGGIIGFIDDWIIKHKKRSLGLKARYKLLLQILLASLIYYLLKNFTSTGTEILLPFWGLWDCNGWFLPIVILIIISTMNALNLTDGIDGLATGAGMIAISFFLFISLYSKDFTSSIFMASLLGACLGFLWFNAYPAKIFMGDTGSMALGASIATCSLLTQTPLWLLWVGGIFVAETLSVILQVIYFRVTKGKRIFRMSPLHHHFELCGLHESSITIRFWITGFFLTATGIYAYWMTVRF